MNVQENWPAIRRAFEASIKSSLCCAIGTVGPDGQPHVTPIGFTFLREDCSAFYFEAYTKRIPLNLAHNPRVCLMVVNSSKWLWLRSLWQGRFDAPPGLRLLGVAGDKRLATAEEIALYQARVRPFRGTKGYDLIWRDLNHVRDVKIDGFEPVVYPQMTDGLWRS